MYLSTYLSFCFICFLFQKLHSSSSYIKKTKKQKNIGKQLKQSSYTNKRNKLGFILPFEMLKIQIYCFTDEFLIPSHKWNYKNLKPLLFSQHKYLNLLFHEKKNNKEKKKLSCKNMFFWLFSKTEIFIYDYIMAVPRNSFSHLSFC